MAITDRRAKYFFKEVGKGYGCSLKDGRRTFRIRHAGFGGGYMIMYTNGRNIDVRYVERFSIEMKSDQITIKYGENETDTATFTVQQKT